jgi:DeoR/GlpR family transcriptional regulator of sugar metabolism
MSGRLLSAEQRKAHILERISSEDLITVAELASSLDVSEMTIRRDFSDLEKEGHLKRVHGGAVSSHGRSYEPPFVLRQSQSADAKQRIAEAAAAMVEEGDSLALDVGSTVLEIARQLVGRRGLTVVTPSLRVVNTLIRNKDIRLIMAGGILRQDEESLVGEFAQQAFKRLFVDKLFLGVGGLDARSGLTEYNWEDAQVKQAMIASAKKVIVALDASKFGRVAFAKVGDLKDIHTVVTNREPPSELSERLAEAGVSVVVTGGGEGREHPGA